jgi:hypothetical protein
MTLRNARVIRLSNGKQEQWNIAQCEVQSISILEAHWTVATQAITLNDLG